jgi:hypothetical protein
MKFLLFEASFHMLEHILNDYNTFKLHYSYLWYT